MDGSAGTEDAKGRSRCGASGRRRSDGLLAFFFFICSRVLCVQVSALQFVKEPRSQDAQQGRGVILRCEVSEVGGVSYSWTLSGQAVLDSERRFQEGSNLKFTAVDRHQDAGAFQCVAFSNLTGETITSTNASINIKWLETGPVTLSEPESELQVQDAQQVVLQCQIDGHPRPTSKWFKNGLPLGGKDRTLALTSPGPEDSGTYHCCARNAVGHVCSSKNVSLSIIDKTVPRLLVAPEDQVVLRNEEAAFHCQFQATPPLPVHWLHESDPVVNRSRVVLYQNGTLRITQVKQRNTGVYKCVVQYGENKVAHAEATLKIAEIEEMASRASHTFSVNARERVTCDSPRGVPEPEVWWEHQGVRVPSEGRVLQRDRVLLFNPTQSSDSGTYTCVAQNRAGQRRQDVMVTVATPPEWIVKPQDTEMEEGKPGFLHCHARGNPEPQVTWFRKAVPITEEGSRYKLFSNGTLRLNSAEVNDGQMYSCRSESHGGFLFGLARVSILEKLKFTPVPQPSQCLQLERESSVTCLAQGQETPVLRWSRADGSLLPSHVSQKAGVLHFHSVVRTDGGNYTCTASNSVQGEIRAHVQLTVGVHVDFQKAPEQTTVYQGNTAVFHCQATGDPQPYVQWKLKDKLLTGASSRFQKMPNGSLVISDVTSEDTGLYTCIAGNSCDIRDAAAQLYVVEKPVHQHEDEDKSQFKMFQTIALSVAVAVAYIIAVLGLMFYCKQRRKSKRLQKGNGGDEPEMERLNGGAAQLNGRSSTELRDEMPLTEMQPDADRPLHFPRAQLHAITTLGRGAFGEVFLAKAAAQDQAEETLVLVKSLQSQDEAAQAQFLRELEMFRGLDHAHVVKLLGVCREAQPHYIILEYVDLGDLKQFLRISRSGDDKLKAHPISTRTKVSICAQVALGMQHLSAQRLVHGDLAARNCLISGQRHVKVSALGLSEDVYKSEYFQADQGRIPLRWLPAESVFDGDFSSQSDAWAFGVLMWEVFSLGELPYPTLTDEQVLEGLRAGKTTLCPPEKVPVKVSTLMGRCWTSGPKERPSFSEIVQTLTDLPTDTKV